MPEEESRPLRVVLATRIYEPEPAAAAFRLSAMVEALAAAGCEVEVLTTRVADSRGGSGAGASTTANARVRVRHWPVLRDAQGYVRGYVPYASFDVPLLLRLLLTRRPDVVVSEQPPTTGAVVRLVCLLRRVPSVYYAADVVSDAAASTGAPAAVLAVLRAVESWGLRGASAVLSVSDGVTQRVRALGARHVVTVGTGADTGVFRLQGEDEGDDDGAGAARDPGLLVYAGTASEWQDAEVFAEAMALVAPRVPGARLVFVGQGSAWPRLREIARSLPDGVVEVRDAVAPARAASLLRSARAALVSIAPGKGYDFAIPTKVFAALACGTPVLYAGPGECAELVRTHDLGWAAPHDVAAVAEAMEAALTGPVPAAERLAAWVEEHRSARAAGERAAAAVNRIAREATAAQKVRSRWLRSGRSR